MQRHLLGLAALAMALVAAGCVKDPTSDLAGTPTRIVASFSKLILTEGDVVLIEAELRDAQGAPLNIMPVATAPTPAVVDIVEQQQAVPQPKLQVEVEATGAGAGIVVLSAEGVPPDTVKVAVFPVTFDGAISVQTGGQLDTVTVAAGSVISFDPAASTVSIDGVPARVLSLTASEAKVLARNTGAVTAARVTLGNVLFLAGTADETPVQSIDAEAAPNIRGEANEPGNNAAATATALPAGGVAEGLVSSSEVDDYFSFVVAGGPKSVTIEVDFDGDGGDPDIDVYLLGPAPTSGNFCALDGCAMGTGAQPETATVTLANGTYYVLVEWFAAGADTPPHYYKVKVTGN